MFRPLFARIAGGGIGRGALAQGVRRASMAWLWVDGRGSHEFWRSRVRASALTLACRQDRYVGLLVWARADDVAKRRRQGLVVCRAASPFRGFFDARPGVTLAPTFTDWVACQSLTVRA